MSLDYQQDLDSVAEDIFNYVQELWVIKDLLSGIHKKLAISSPYLNFRDALFHYKKMFAAAKKHEEVSFIKQRACIEEHLNRGLKDFAIFLCANYYTKVLHMMIETPTEIAKPAVPKLRQIYHNIKNIVVKIRMEGQTLDHFDTQKTAWLPDVVSIIKTFQDYLNEDDPLKIKRLYEKHHNEVLKSMKLISDHP